MCIIKEILIFLKEYVQALTLQNIYVCFAVPSAACLLFSIIPDSGTIRLSGQDFLAQV